ncbi:DUF4382 domain-containing protein [Desulfuromonas sp. AOP6]|uniref:DUF4382 domain-containing protein n=1 Tax=Desulfuromonas sp. AOP6 TaxID=1566351 RepID=UPI001272ADEC|nr:DUF4382 domain-containing protein [Desulfuromonas sp. AOP6]BCA78466.1 hypothetical protein AOP6_0253 [Desulfuromonas sp. AOP6]
MKKMNNVKLLLGMLLSIGLLMLAACGGSSSSGSAATGTLSLQMVDATTPDFKAIYVTIDRVDVHLEGGDWTTVATPQKTYNLLELVNGVQETLGEEELAPGNYTQMRLILSKNPDDGLNLLDKEHEYGNYVITLDDVSHELKTPSGLQSGIKLVNGFTIASNETTELILDFDAARSVVVAGNLSKDNYKYLLKPTIKVVASAATVQGRVVEIETEKPLPSTRVSAHATDSAETLAATLSNEDGYYALFLNPGDYQVVSFRAPMGGQGYAPACEPISLTSDDIPRVNFQLVPADHGTLSGEVTGATLEDGEYVVLSIQQTAPAPCSGMVELATVQIEEGLYSIDLPVGTYELVASMLNEESQLVGDPQVIEDVTITTEAATEQNITF